MSSSTIFALARWELHMQFLQPNLMTITKSHMTLRSETSVPNSPCSMLSVAWFKLLLYTYIPCRSTHCGLRLCSTLRYCRSRLTVTGACRDCTDAVSPKVAKNQTAISLAAGIPSRMARQRSPKAAEPLPKSGPSHNRFRAFCATQSSVNMV
jgi:hypothetical protein